MPINNGIKDNRHVFLLLLLLLLLFTSQMHSMLLILKIEFPSPAQFWCGLCLRFGHRMFALSLFIHSHSDGFISNAHTQYTAIHSCSFRRRCAAQFSIDQYNMHGLCLCDTISSECNSFFCTILMDT